MRAMSPMLRIAAMVLVAMAAGAAAAQEARKFAVLSLIGDKFMVVTHVAETGERLGRNRQTDIALPERAFDNAVAADVEHAIHDLMPSAPVVKLGGGRALYPADIDVSEDPDPLAVLARVRAAIEPSGVTHLVLVAKLRHETRMPMINTTQGSGKLQGVGFYMDPTLFTEDRQADQAGRGYLAPYAYFRVALLDVAKGAELGHVDVIDAAPVTAGRSPSLQVWEALSAHEKVKLVHQLAQRGVERAVGQLLGKL